MVEDVNGLTPAQVYKIRQQIYRGKQAKFKTSDDRLALARGFTFLLIVILVWLSLVEEYFSPMWPIVFVAVFLVLVVAHSRIARRLAISKRAATYYTRRLDHIAGNWSGQGNPGMRYYDDSHPYSSDLDIFGEGALFEYICGTRTRIGEDTLADWLCSGADLQTIKERQKAIAELRSYLDLFEQFALLEAETNVESDQNQLRHWCNSKVSLFSRLQIATATVLGALALLSIVAWIVGFGSLPFLTVLLLELAFYSVNLKKIQRYAAEAAAAASGLTILSQVMSLIEDEQFESPVLRRLCADLQCAGHRPSWQISRLNSLVHWLENSLRNQIIGPVALMTGVPFYFMLQIDHWRERVGPSVSEWFNAIGQMEALCSLARYAFENPADPFPEFIPDSEPVSFEAEGLCHPLIPKEVCVSNDIKITNERSLIMVSGSNMSGKSTLLRTIGINVVLASCGAPVRANRALTSRFQIGCAMRANDSLQRGVSLFYSVISRIKSVFELAGRSPTLLFLLDEILQGTNSQDRRIGAEGIIRQLLGKNAVGLITTHDLALTEIVDSLGSAAVNIHFEDHLENGQMHFDYKIRQGIVKKSNALELMRMIGLDIDSSDTDGTAI